jgi:hypothetical protein
LLDQGVQERTTYLNEKYEWLSADYEELRRMVIDIRSQMSGTYTPPIGPQSRERPASSSSSSVAFVLVSLYLNA